MIPPNSTNQTVNNDSLNSCIESELVLEIGEKLQIVVAHRKTGEVKSHGFLQYQHSGVVLWYTANDSELFTDPFPRIRDLSGYQDCDTFIARTGDSCWYLYEPVRARFEPDRMVITVDRTGFSLGSGK